MEYILSNLDTSVIKSITTAVKVMCKQNNINYEKQNYNVLFSNEKLFVKNNNVKFTSGSKKYLSFYGKLYSNKNGKIIENIYLKDSLITLEPEINNFLMISGGVENSTVVNNDEELLYFYVAPQTMLKMQDPGLWQNL